MDSRRLLLLLAAIAAFARVDVAVAQCPLPPIPNFNSVNYANGQWTFKWDAPAGAPAGTSYQILRETGPNWCALPKTLFPIATTTSTTYTASLSAPNTVYGFMVQVAGTTCSKTTSEMLRD